MTVQTTKLFVNYARTMTSVTSHSTQTVTAVTSHSTHAIAGGAVVGRLEPTRASTTARRVVATSRRIVVGRSVAVGNICDAKRWCYGRQAAINVKTKVALQMINCYNLLNMLVLTYLIERLVYY